MIVYKVEEWRGDHWMTVYAVKSYPLARKLCDVWQRIRLTTLGGAA